MKTKHVFYVAVFTEEEDGRYSVIFPDVPEALTQGDTLDDAYVYAQDALGLALYDQKTLPFPQYKAANLAGNQQAVLIALDLETFRGKMNVKTVKKNTTIPEYLAKMAEEEKINFSTTLTEALKQKLGV